MQFNQACSRGSNDNNSERGGGSNSSSTNKDDLRGIETRIDKIESNIESIQKTLQIF